MFAAHKPKSPDTFRYQDFKLVRLAGIEPTTPWFVAKYSIQLSYSRIGGEGGIRTHGTLFTYA